MENKQSILKAFLLIISLLMVSISFAATSSESCSVQGSKQYQPDGICETSIRECCGNGYFSLWREVCSGKDDCSSLQCWSSLSKKCENRPSSECSIRNGTCKYTYTCSGLGWLGKKSITCFSGWILDGGECIKYRYTLNFNGPSGGTCPDSLICSASEIGKTCSYRRKVSCPPCLPPTPGGLATWCDCICNNSWDDVPDCYKYQRDSMVCAKTSFEMISPIN